MIETDGQTCADEYLFWISEYLKQKHVVGPFLL